MLRVYLHAGGLDERNLGNQLASIDIAYAKKSALADYLVGMNLRSHGEVEPDYVLRYPRWSASLWDLVARALTRLQVDVETQCGTVHQRQRIDAAFTGGVQLLANKGGESTKRTILSGVRVDSARCGRI